MSLISAAALLLGLSAAAPTPAHEPKLVLRASTERPYVGQEVTLWLDIDVPEAARAEAEKNPPKLDVPWLVPGFGFTWLLSPDQWACRQAKRRDGLRCALRDPSAIIRAEPVTDSGKTAPGIHRYRLSWKLVIGEPDQLTGGKINFAPIQLTLGQAKVASNSLLLQVQKLPLPPPDASPLNLGVGPFAMTVSLDPAKVTLSEETILTLRVSGPANLTQLTRPRLTLLPGYDRPINFFVENGTETWEADDTARYFRYLLRPRHEAFDALPPIAYTYFDPADAKYHTRTIEPLPLQVLLPKAKSYGLYPPGSVPQRLKLTPVDASRPITSLDPWTALVLLLVPPAFWGLAWLTVRAGWLNGSRNSRLTLSRPARTALDRLRQAGTVPPDLVAESVVAVLHDFLHDRFGIRVAEPTASELATALEDHSVAAEAITSTLELWRDSSAARFGGQPGGGLVRRAGQVIRTLDATL